MERVLYRGATASRFSLVTDGSEEEEEEVEAEELSFTESKREIRRDTKDPSHIVFIF